MTGEDISVGAHEHIIEAAKDRELRYQPSSPWFALVGEHVFGIQPCILCTCQRVPYVVTALVAGAAAALPISSGTRRLALVLCGVVFGAGAVLAF